MVHEESFLARVLDGADALVLVLTPDGIVRRANGACERLSGWQASELVNRPFWDCFADGADADVLKRRLLAAATQDGVQRFEAGFLTRAGRRRRISWSVGAIAVSSGAPEWLVATGSDVTLQAEALDTLRRSEEMYHTLLESANDAIIVADADTGLIVQANQQAEHLLGQPVHELIGTPEVLLFPPAHQARALQLWQETVEGGHTLSGDLAVRHRDGHTIPVELSASRAELGNRRLVQGIYRDLSERRRAEERLRKLSAVVDVSPNLIIISDRHGTIEYCNPFFYESTGYTEAEVIGQNPRILKSGETSPETYRALWQTIRSGQVWFGEFRNRKKNGQLFWSLNSISPIRDEQGAITHFVSIGQDISRLKYAESTVRQLAYYDPLTELPNRVLFQERLSQAVAAAREYGQIFAVLFVDLDHFKTANDVLGHGAGDRLLVEVAGRLGSVIRESATLARLGGDEFAIITPVLEREGQAAICAEQIRNVLGPAFVLDGRTLHVSASVGITLFPRDGASTDTLMANADLAMFKAKESGRGHYRFFTTDLDRASAARLELESSLRRGLERDEFELLYQPKYAVDSGRIVGVEALLRWRHPDQGLLAPGGFMETAEETGLILAIGEQVLKRAAGQLARWHRVGHRELHVAVNLTSRQFRQEGLPVQVRQALRDSGIPPEALELEITESELMETGAAAVELLRTLKGMGVRLAIDDFGTGYSSLAYLKRFPIDTLKVDRSFVADLPESAEDTAIVRAIIVLGRTLGLQVVAEGVENADQLRCLERLECHQVQGFWFSRPVTAEAMTALLADQSEAARGSG